MLKSSSAKSTKTIDFIRRISNFNTRERQFANEKWSHRYRKSKYCWFTGATNDRSIRTDLRSRKLTENETWDPPEDFWLLENTELSRPAGTSFATHKIGDIRAELHFIRGFCQFSANIPNTCWQDDWTSARYEPNFINGGRKCRSYDRRSAGTPRCQKLSVYKDF